MSLRPFHLALTVNDLDVARMFYGQVLGCAEGRSAATWVDFDFFGHQLSLHCSQELPSAVHNAVDGDAVPVPHFGVVLEWSDWHELARRLEEMGTDFCIPPRIRFEGKPGEQATMFFLDPAGNALEFKSFREDREMFKSE